MILIALGANLPSSFGAPKDTCEAALAELDGEGVKIVKRSRWYSTAPVPASDQPWYVNGVAQVETSRGPRELLALLHSIEAKFGRVRSETNAARVIDLDLLAHGSHVIQSPDITVPHPRMTERAFVVMPLVEIAPDWVHPVLRQPARALISLLTGEQRVL